MSDKQKRPHKNGTERERTRRRPWRVPYSGRNGAPARTGTNTNTNTNISNSSTSTSTSTSTSNSATLERHARDIGIDWRAARSEMIDGDAETGARQLTADLGDAVEVPSVNCWLRLLEARAIRFGWRRGLRANSSMHWPATRLIHASESE